MNKAIHIFGGGTISHVRTHLALCAPAYGKTARTLQELCRKQFPAMDVVLHLSRMAGGDQETPNHVFETYEDLRSQLIKLVDNPTTKIIFMNAAVVDFRGEIDGMEPDKYAQRLSSEANYQLNLTAYPKLLSEIRKTRKDIFLIGFKTTSGATPAVQFQKALNLCKRSSVNLVLANDVVTRNNIIVTPEEGAYEFERDTALSELVRMVFDRSHLTFTQSQVVGGEPVSWSSPDIPANLRSVVNFCVQHGAYKEHRGVTSGHFACKLSDQAFLTSIRRTNFNDIEKHGLVRIVTDGPDTVLAYGAKPSVGGQSQRIVFRDHPGYDCIVHFHCPIREGSQVPVVSQKEFECGSHECGANTSRGLKEFTIEGHSFGAVYLEKHGPNIVFSKETPHSVITRFIEDNFSLTQTTSGYELQ